MQVHTYTPCVYQDIFGLIKVHKDVCVHTCMSIYVYILPLLALCWVTLGLFMERAGRDVTFASPELCCVTLGLFMERAGRDVSFASPELCWVTLGLHEECPGRDVTFASPELC